MDADAEKQHENEVKMKFKAALRKVTPLYIDQGGPLWKVLRCERLRSTTAFEGLKMLSNLTLLFWSRT